MKVFMSLWTRQIFGMMDTFSAVVSPITRKTFQNTNRDMWKLSLALARKHYGEVELITDTPGAKMMAELPFSCFHTLLDDLPDLPNIWSLGKIFAYRHAASTKLPFLHLDGDVFLWEPLPKTLTNSPFFAQSIDLLVSGYRTPKMKVPDEWASDAQAYNMGIFGGSDTELISKYAEFAIGTVLKHEEILKRIPSKFSNNVSCLAEQGSFGIFCEKTHNKPELLLKGSGPSKKYTHLMSRKNSPEVMRRISERLSRKPYDLEPNELQPGEWPS